MGELCGSKSQTRGTGGDLLIGFLVASWDVFEVRLSSATPSR